jgi:hypothetical protein
MANGRLAKLKQGKAVTTPPAGYVWGADGAWVKDERPGVQDSIKAHFRAIREARSLRQATRLLREQGIESPHRMPGGEIGWSQPTVNTLQRMVRNPAYVGDVAYGRRRSDPLRGRDGRGRWRTSLAALDDVIMIRDHHDPYVAREDLTEINGLLERNAWSPRHGVLGPGHALGQGCLRCAKHHNRRMRAIPKTGTADGEGRSVYICNGEVREGGPRCGPIPQWVIDTPLREATVDRLAPMALGELRPVMRQAESDTRAEERRRRDALHRLRMEVEDLQYRYDRVDLDLTAVARGCAENLELKRRELLRLEREESERPARGVVFDDRRFAELQCICADLNGLLDAPSTRPRDRKELVRIMVDRAVVEERTPERVMLRIVWNDGAPDTVKTVLLFPYAHRIILEMNQQGATPAAIADRLNRDGVRTKYQSAWTAQNVRRHIYRIQEEDAAVIFIRIPKGLHREIKLYCVQQGISVMQFVADAITEGLNKSRNK